MKINHAFRLRENKPMRPKTHRPCVILLIQISSASSRKNRNYRPLPISFGKITQNAQYNPACDISIPADSYIDWRDLDVLTANWLAGK